VTHIRRTTLHLLVLLGTLTLGLHEAQAQSRPPSRYNTPQPAVEFSATYGSMWGGSVGTRSGKLRAGTGESWGLALDIPVPGGAFVELSYTRQNGSLDLDNWGVTTLTDMSVNHYQIGGLRSLMPGPVSPFVFGGLGATHFSPAESTVVIDETVYPVQAYTRFSMHFGAGFKAYFGKAEKVGIRASFKFLPTLYNTGGGLWFGSGGASVGLTGSAIWQYEIAGGLTVKFGG